MPKKAKRALRQVIVYLSIFIFILIIFLLADINLVSTIVIFFLITISSFSKIYKHITHFSVGFELITLTSILFAYKIGIGFAIGANIVMLLVAGLLSGRLEFSSIVAQGLVYATTIILTRIFSGVEFVPLAVAMVVYQNAVTLPVDYILSGRNFLHGIFISVFSSFMSIVIVLAVGNFFVNLI